MSPQGKDSHNISVIEDRGRYPHGHCPSPSVPSPHSFLSSCLLLSQGPQQTGSPTPDRSCVCVCTRTHTHGTHVQVHRCHPTPTRSRYTCPVLGDMQQTSWTRGLKHHHCHRSQESNRLVSEQVLLGSGSPWVLCPHRHSPSVWLCCCLRIARHTHMPCLWNHTCT